MTPDLFHASHFFFPPSSLLRFEWWWRWWWLLGDATAAGAIYFCCVCLWVVVVVRLRFIAHPPYKNAIAYQTKLVPYSVLYTVRSIVQTCAQLAATAYLLYRLQHALCMSRVRVNQSTHASFTTKGAREKASRLKVHRDAGLMVSLGVIGDFSADVRYSRTCIICITVYVLHTDWYWCWFGCTVYTSLHIYIVAIRCSPCTPRCYIEWRRIKLSVDGVLIFSTATRLKLFVAGEHDRTCTHFHHGIKLLIGYTLHWRTNRQMARRRPF